MQDTTKVTPEALEDLQEQGSSISFDFRSLFKMFVLNWQWFFLSVFIAASAVLIYLRYTPALYQMSSKMLIKDEDQRTRRSANMLANMQDLGFMTNSAGIENEVEILDSRLLARAAIMDLKLYTEYYVKGRLTKRLIYRNQPVTVDLDTATLNRLDDEMLDSLSTINLKLTRQEGGYHVEGKTMLNGRESSHFQCDLKNFPTRIQTRVGQITFSQAHPDTLKVGTQFLVDIVPPMVTAARYVGRLTVAPTTKMTQIAKLTLTDANARRGMDFLKQLALCYNRQANDDKNEIALKTEEFINERLEKINAELGSTEGELESYKRSNRVTQLSMDANQSLQMSSQYATKLSEANSQIQLLDYLREYVDNPRNQYKIIPSNVGMTDGASTSLISNYNQAVQERNRLLKSASEHAPQVQTLTATLDELQGSIRQALLQARRSADIQRQGIQNELAKYQSRVSSTPAQERMLTQIGRQQEVRSGLYLMLLQKREENSISLAATADKGKLIDAPLFEGKLGTKRSVLFLGALIVGLIVPMVILFLLQLMRFRIEGHEDVERLTKLPIIADIAVASESAKDSAGIVVHENSNETIDEIFRSLRTNIQFMLKENEKTILFTSSTSGEGKTFLAANLAVSFALLGKKVALCGLDIRKPALGRLFDTKDREKGITTLLLKDHITAQDVRSQILPSGLNANLDLLLAGVTPPNPTELLARENLGQVLDVLQQEYDYVILDTAPVGLVSDTLQMARFANVTCYVCRADYTPKANMGMLNQLAGEQKLPNACVILNGVDMSKKKYGYYYGYGNYGKLGRYGRYGGNYGSYGRYGQYGQYGNYSDSHYGNKKDKSIKK